MEIFPCYWTFVKRIHQWPVDSPHKGQWRGALMFSLICGWTNGWADNRATCDWDDVVLIVTSLYWTLCLQMYNPLTMLSYQQVQQYYACFRPNILRRRIIPLQWCPKGIEQGDILTLVYRVWYLTCSLNSTSAAVRHLINWALCWKCTLPEINKSRQLIGWSGPLLDIKTVYPAVIIPIIKTRRPRDRLITRIAIFIIQHFNATSSSQVTILS